MKYNVVERFTSIQGEGAWTGTQMDFVRLAQCPVGKMSGMCKLWDGTKFICDTGPMYRGIKEQKGDVTEWHPYTEVNAVLDEQQIIEDMETSHLCLTGGEPLIYDIGAIVEHLPNTKKLHIETSGTVNLPWWTPWVTLSPKENWLESMVERANELKLLVHHATTENQVRDWIRRFHPESRPFYLQAIESEDREEWRRNIEWAMSLLKLNQHLRLSIQVHKAIEVR